MDFFILKIVSGILSLGVVTFAWNRLSGNDRVFFILMIGFFFVSTVYFFSGGVINEWLKHLPFFTGQIFLYFFISSLIKTWQKAPAPSVTLTAGFVVPTWFALLTKQGLQHILVLPLFLLFWGAISIKGSQLDSKLRSQLNAWLLGGFFLVLIHIGHFVVEAQEWVPFLNGRPIDIIEFFWYYLAMVTFAIALNKNKKHATIKRL